MILIIDLVYPLFKKGKGRERIADFVSSAFLFPDMLFDESLPLSFTNRESSRLQ
jgi:hypothetical protein